jgi:hypothetical protein
MFSRALASSLFLVWRGYGISDEEYERMQSELKHLFLLKSFDKPRWAIDGNPPKTTEFVERAKRLLALNLL